MEDEERASTKGLPSALFWTVVVVLLAVTSTPGLPGATMLETAFLFIALALGPFSLVMWIRSPDRDSTADGDRAFNPWILGVGAAIAAFVLSIVVAGG